jgi:hypothetical protein
MLRIGTATTHKYFTDVTRALGQSVRVFMKVCSKHHTREHALNAMVVNKVCDLSLYKRHVLGNYPDNFFWIRAVSGR